MILRKAGLLFGTWDEVAMVNRGVTWEITDKPVPSQDGRMLVSMAAVIDDQRETWTLLLDPSDLIEIEA